MNEIVVMISFKDFKGYYKFNEKILLGSQSLLDEIIIRYTSFRNFLKCLSDNKFFVSSRSNFTDRHEIGEFAKRINYFRLQRADGEDQAHWREEDEKIKCCRYLFTSCWSRTDIESVLMWKASNYDVAIISNVSDFLRSISVEESCAIIANSVVYEKERPLGTLESALFKKELAYRDENELRIYFIKEVDLSNPSKIECNKFIKMNDSKYIKGVILSPFIDAKIRTILKDYINKTYPDVRVIQSLIIDKVQ